MSKDEEIAQLKEALAAERENLMKLERDWHKVINEVLKCNPIPARDRTDDQLEPPWEVIARIRQQLAAEREQLEHERMCHVACGVIAMSNTPESLARNSDMKPEYLSASVQDCIRAIKRELKLREQLAAERETHIRNSNRKTRTIEALTKELEEGKGSYHATLIVAEQQAKELAAARDIAKSWYEHAVRAEEELAAAVAALKRIREVALKTDWELAKQIDAALEKVSNLNEK